MGDNYIETECVCGASHAAKFDDRPEETVECGCGRVLRVLWRSLRDGAVVAQKLSVVRESA